MSARWTLIGNGGGDRARAFFLDHGFEHAARAPGRVVRFDADFDALFGLEAVEQLLHVGERHLIFL
jgi:hypothetical protein